MRVVHKVTGYDRLTDKLELAFEVPEDRFREISDLVSLPSNYLNSFGSFPLDASAAWKISWALHLQMNVDHYDWFIEPFSCEHASLG